MKKISDIEMLCLFGWNMPLLCWFLDAVPMVL
jgi:hypothetical protein